MSTHESVGNCVATVYYHAFDVAGGSSCAYTHHTHCYWLPGHHKACNICINSLYMGCRAFSEGRLLSGRHHCSESSLHWQVPMHHSLGPAPHQRYILSVMHLACDGALPTQSSFSSHKVFTFAICCSQCAMLLCIRLQAALA